MRQKARGEPLSPYEWLSLKSFIDFGHRFDLLERGELGCPNVPAKFKFAFRAARAIVPLGRIAT